MAFEGLTAKLSAAFKKLRSKGKLNENDVKEAMREVRIALLEADVNFKVAKDFVLKVTERAIGSEVLESLTPAQQVIKIVNEEMIALMGGTQARLVTASKPPSVLLLCGLQGAGKTTLCAKLAAYLKKSGHRPLLAACDIYRPAAIKQLEVVGAAAGVPVFTLGQISPVKIAAEAIRHAKDYGNDFVLLDTAGRLHIDETLMDELRDIKSAVDPQEILLVIDAMTGQDAVTTASAFDQALGITGTMVTKLDGDTRGGVALSVKAVTGKPIKFCGTGEKIDALEEFHPDRMASRILGMGDMLTLIEKAQEQFDEKKSAELAKKMQGNKMNLDDFLDQLRQMRKMGSMKQLLGMIPGVGNQLDQVELDDRMLPRMEAILTSMTRQERIKPDLINASRKRRIAAGSGTRVEDVNKILKQFDQMQKMMKQMAGKGKGKKNRGLRFGGGPRSPFLPGGFGF